MAARGRHLLQRLQRLVTATLVVGFAGAVVGSRVVPRPADGGMDQTRRLLRQVRHELRMARPITADPAIKASVRQIESMLADIQRVVASPDQRALRALGQEVCVSAQPGMLFLSTGPFFDAQGSGFATLRISGNLGGQTFTFASGAIQANIISSINGFKKIMGVSAAQSQVNPARVGVFSTRTNSTVLSLTDSIGSC